MTNPTLMPRPFAENGQKNEIQNTRQSGQQPQDATLNDGFPPVTMIPKESGGIPPNGLDMNGILNLISQDTCHRQRGERIQFSFAYATAIGGYPKGAILQSNDATKELISLVDGNMVDPNSTNISGFWAIYSGQGSVPTATSTTTGTVKLINNLTSTATDAALSAAQGKILYDIFTNFEFSSLPNGYMKIPFGSKTFIAQWGTVDYPSNPGEIQANVSFPIQFPTACLNVMGMRKIFVHANNGDGGILLISSNNSGASFSLQIFNNDSIASLRGFTWFAIGY